MIKPVLHRPDYNKRPDTAVVEVTGFRSTPENTKARLDYLANALGTSVISFFRAGTATTVIDLGMRRSLHPTRYRETVADQLVQTTMALENVGEHFDELVGHGPSGGGILVGALALHGLFDRIQLSDGINHRALHKPEGTLSGTLNFLSYLIAGERNLPKDPAAPELAKAPVPPLSTLIGQTAIEVFNYNQLMLSTETARIATELAKDATLPMHVVSFGHTFTGDNVTAYNFGDFLEETRQGADLGIDLTAPAQLKTTFARAMRHSDLTSRPDLMAGLLEQTFTLKPAQI